MSIIIQGMEMPSCCMFCTISNSSGCGMMNPPVLMTTKEMLADRPDWCPLLPLPNKHWRLIDADELLERFEKEEKAADEHGRDFSFSFKSGGENCTEWLPVQLMLMDAPTIIPASKEGE